MLTHTIRRTVPRTPYLTFQTLAVLCPADQYLEILAKCREGGTGTTEYFRRKDADFANTLEFMPVYGSLCGSDCTRFAKAFLHYRDDRTNTDWWLTEKPDGTKESWFAGLVEDSDTYGYRSVQFGGITDREARLDIDWEPTEIRLIDTDA